MYLDASAIAQIDVASLLDTLNVKELSMSASIHVKSIAAAGEYGKVAAGPARLNMGDRFSQIRILSV